MTGGKTYGRTCFVDEDGVHPPNHYRPHDNSKIGSQLDGMDADCVGGRNAIAHRQPLSDDTVWDKGIYVRGQRDTWQ